MNGILIRIIAFFAALSAMLTQMFRIPVLPRIPEYVEAEADALAEKAAALSSESAITFIAASDAHQHSLTDSVPFDSPENVAAQNIIIGNLHAGMAMELLTRKLKIDFCAFLGDYTAGGPDTTTEEGLRQIREVNEDIDAAFAGLPQFRTTGNHDPLGYSYGINGTYLSAEELAPLIAAYNEGAVFGNPVSGYCYRDFSAGSRTVRVICLNTSEFTEETSPAWSGNAVEGIAAAQKKWFAETLLETGAKGADWSIIVLSHHPPDWGGAVTASNILYAYVTGDSIKLDGEIYDFENKNAATFICAFHGHTHCYKTDRLHAVSDYTATPYNAYRMAIPNMCFLRNNEYGKNGKAEYFGIEFGDDITYNKTAGTANDTAFCLITVDLETQTVYAWHYGAGPAENDKCRILHYASFDE